MSQFFESARKAGSTPEDTRRTMEFFYESLTIYGYDRRHRPDKLSTTARRWISEQLRIHTASSDAEISVAELCHVAIAKFHLGKFDAGEHARLWDSARKIPEHTVTAENDVTREWVVALIEIDEPLLAVRTLWWAVQTMQQESIERQGLTAFLASAIAATEQSTVKEHLYSDEARQLWDCAVAAGESVDQSSVIANLTHLAQLNTAATEAAMTPGTQSYSGLNTKVLMTEEAIGFAADVAPHIFPKGLAGGARGGVI